MSRRRRAWLHGVARVTFALIALAVPRWARAEQADAPAPAPASPVHAATSGGSLLPLTLPADVGRAHAFAIAFGGYDSAARNARLVSFAEAHVYGPLALRFSAQSTGVSEKIAPSLAARLQFLSELKHGVDAAISLAYNAEGFSELEGELELVLTVGKSFGNWRLLANVAYGQDPEGKERDGELRAAALCHLGTYYLGVDGRGRLDLGSASATLSAHGEPWYDIDVGPVLELALGPVVLGAHAGFSTLALVGSEARFGALALAGLGSAW